MFCIVSYLVASTIATRIGLSLGLQGLQIIYVDQINDSSSSSSSSSVLYFSRIILFNLFFFLLLFECHVTQLTIDM